MNATTFRKLPCRGSLYASMKRKCITFPSVSTHLTRPSLTSNIGIAIKEREFICQMYC